MRRRTVFILVCLGLITVVLLAAAGIVTAISVAGPDTGAPEKIPDDDKSETEQLIDAYVEIYDPDIYYIGGGEYDPYYTSGGDYNTYYTSGGEPQYYYEQGLSNYEISWYLWLLQHYSDIWDDYDDDDYDDDYYDDDYYDDDYTYDDDYYYDDDVVEY